MSPPAAKKGHRVTGLDTHMIQPPGPSSPVPTPHPFSGVIDGALSGNVNVNGMPAATVDSTATNTPPHVPIGGSFVNPPSNKATIKTGSGTVTINGKKAARAGDTAETCNDPKDAPVGSVVAVSTVNIGG
jgi:uncharacterized Zn-binding protein involved in type VI secretion